MNSNSESNFTKTFLVEPNGVKIMLNDNKKIKFEEKHIDVSKKFSEICAGSVQFCETEKNSSNLLDCSVHPFVEAIRTAYGYHYPLVITPDIIWYLISSGVCEYIDRNSEKLRYKFVDHKGKQPIKVEISDSSPETMKILIEEFSKKIQERTKTQVANLMLNDFSTTTKCSRLVSQIVMMDSFQHYFTYNAMCICGIPEIQIKGTKDDWIHLKEKMANILKEFPELTVWAEKMEVILQNFINVYDNNVDYEFWDQIFLLNISKMPVGGYNLALIEKKRYNGWFLYFFPYFERGIKNYFVFDKENQILNRNFGDTGIKLEKLKHSLNKAPFILNRSPHKVAGGLIGIEIDETNNDALTPIFGYAVLAEHYGQIIQSKSTDGSESRESAKKIEEKNLSSDDSEETQNIKEPNIQAKV